VLQWAIQKNLLYVYKKKALMSYKSFQKLFNLKSKTKILP